MEVHKLNTASFWEERLSANYDEIGVGYSSLGKSFNKWMYKHRLRHLKSVIQKFNIKVEGKVLDIGSGTGFYIAFWNQFSPKSVSGIDITDVAVDNLQRKFPDCFFLKADISVKDFRLKEKYDLISAFDILFHIVDDSKYEIALNNIASSLNSNGVFVFTENFAPRENASTHIKFREELKIKRLLSEKGLKVLKTTPVFYLMNEPVSSNDKLITIWWKLLKNFLKVFPFLGNITGAILYCIEGSLVSNKAMGPSTHLIICQKA